MSYVHAASASATSRFHSPAGCSKGRADQYVVDYARLQHSGGCIPHELGFLYRISARQRRSGLRILLRALKTRHHTLRRRQARDKVVCRRPRRSVSLARVDINEDMLSTLAVRNNLVELIELIGESVRTNTPRRRI